MPARGLRSNRDNITTRQIQQPTSGPLPDSASPTKNGTVTSVGLTVPGRQSVAGSPITSAGTLAVTDDPQNANEVFAGPSSGSPAVPGFRALVGDDLPLAPTPASPVSNDTLIRVTIGGVGYDILAMEVV